MAHRTLVARLLIGAVLALAVTPVAGQQSVVGQWSPVFSMPLVAVHAAIMPAGRLLLFDAWEIPGTPSARLWDPVTDFYTEVKNEFAELFCAGHVLTPNGRLLTTGGHNGSGVGTTDATYFDPTTLQWTALPDLQYARWYPSVTPLADGRTLTLGGAISRPSIAEIPEILSADGLAWTGMPVAQKDVGEYPLAFQGPDGRVFVAGYDASLQTWLLNVGSGTWSPLGRSPAAAGTGVMYRPGKIMMTGGGTLGVDPVTGATGVIDLNVPTPSWQQVGSMAHGRSQHNLVILPDGKVLVIGGASEVSLIAKVGVKPAEIWDPDTGNWTQVASMARSRMYHSIAILLPDGRVLAAGGGRINPVVTDETNGEFYSPPYLFNGTRPAVTSAPAGVNYGASFNVALPDPAAAARVTFVRVSSVTHGVNFDQRFFELSFTAGAGSLTVTAPSDMRLAPAGDYFLFVLNAAGVPSEGRVVRLGGTAPPAPSLVIGDVSVNEGTAAGNNATFSVTLNGTSAQTVTVNYATVNGTAQAGSDYSSRSDTLTFNPGMTSRTVTVPTVPDAVPENNETFSVVLSGATNAIIGDATAVGRIIDDDEAVVPAVSINSVNVVEQSSGTPVAAFTVSLSTASAVNVLVDYQTQPGSATAPADYTSTKGTLTFAGGTTVQTIQVPIVPDLVPEPNETFTVELLGPVNATLGTAVGTATIINDDLPNLPPVISAATGTPVSGTAPLGVTFNAAATDPEGAPLTYTWAFGDATGGAGASIAHVYTTPGAYTATLMVSDGTNIAAALPIAVTVAASPPPPPPQPVQPAPRNLAATTWRNTIHLSWLPPGVAMPVEAYLLEAGLQPGETLLTVPLGPQPGLTTSAPDGVYFARVRAVSAGVPGPASNEVRIALGGAAPPLAPLALLATVQGTTVTLHWTDNPMGPAVGGYLLQAGTAPGSADLGVLPLDAATHDLSVPVPPGTYYARVLAVNAAGAGPPSNEAVISAGPGVCTVPAAPAGFSGAAAGGLVTVSWSGAAAGAIPTSYALRAGPVSGSSDLALPLSPQTTTLSGPLPPGTYYLQVFAVNECGAAPSPEIVVTVP